MATLSRLDVEHVAHLARLGLTEEEVTELEGQLNHILEQFAVLSELDPREERIIRLRFGLDKDQAPMTLEEVGAFFNVTRERIRQIEAKSLEKLRLLLAERDSSAEDD